MVNFSAIAANSLCNPCDRTVIGIYATVTCDSEASKAKRRSQPASGKGRLESATSAGSEGSRSSSSDVAQSSLLVLAKPLLPPMLNTVPRTIVVVACLYLLAIHLLLWLAQRTERLP